MTNLELNSLLAKIIIKVRSNDTDDLIDLILQLNKENPPYNGIVAIMESLPKQNYNDALEILVEYISEDLYSKDRKEKLLWISKLETLAHSDDKELIHKFLIDSVKNNDIQLINKCEGYYRTVFIQLCLSLGEFDIIEMVSEL